MACLFTVLLYKRLMWLMYCDLAGLLGDLHRKLISQISKHAARSGSSSTSARRRSSGWRVHLRSIRSPIHSLCGEDGERATRGPPANTKASDYIRNFPRSPPQNTNGRAGGPFIYIKRAKHLTSQLQGFLIKGRGGRLRGPFEWLKGWIWRPGADAAGADSGMRCKGRQGATQSAAHLRERMQRRAEDHPFTGRNEYRLRSRIEMLGNLLRRKWNNCCSNQIVFSCQRTP